MSQTEFHKASGLFTGLMLLLLLGLPVLAVNGLIIDESTDDEGYGWTLMKVWGDHYEAGYAHGWLLADEIVEGYDDVSATVVRWGYSWPELRFAINTYYSEMPDYIETELTGIADGVYDRTGESIDWIDLLCVNMIGDAAYLCRSLSAWGSTTDGEHSTVTLRRLDYSDMGMDMVYHHVVCMWCVEDQPDLINFGWPGYVTVVTGVNEYGVVTSLHDWNSSSGTILTNSMGRTIASRYVLTLFDSPDLSWQADSAFAMLSDYHAGTGRAINFMAPEGQGGRFEKPWLFRAAQTTPGLLWRRYSLY